MPGSAAVFRAVTSPDYFIFVLKELIPEFKVLSPTDVVTRLKRAGLTDAYATLKMDYEQSNVVQ